MYGELIPFGGGDSIPLMKPSLLVGRRESCDIVLRFPNVSAHHCELSLEQGYWFVRDLNSRNGTKVNGLRVTAKKRVDPGDRLAIAQRNYEFRYSPTMLGAEGPPPDEAALGDILGQSLMKSAGLERREQQTKEGRIGVRRPARPTTTTPSQESSQTAEDHSSRDDVDRDDPDSDEPEKDDA